MLVTNQKLMNSIILTLKKFTLVWMLFLMKISFTHGKNAIKEKIPINFDLKNGEANQPNSSMFQ